MANLRVDKITSTETFETTGSVQFDGTGDYLDVTESNNDFDFDGDFTIEFWVYFNTVNERNDTVGSGNNSVYLGSSKSGWIASYYTLSGSKWHFSYQSNQAWIFEHTFSFTSDASRWYHVAFTREDSSIKCFVDGVQQGATKTSSTTLTSTENSVRVGGGEGSTSLLLNGYVSNLRVIKGKALYTSNFKPPMRELEVTPETVLLACQSKTDASLEKTGKVITVNGNAVANELTPGLLTPIVKSGGGSAITGSVEFNYNDYFQITSADLALGTDPFTIEWWMYASEQTEPGTANRRIFRLGANNATGSLSINFDAVNHDLQINYNDTTLIGSSSLGVHPESWYHISLVREGTGSNETKLYINGILSDSGTLDSDVNFSQTALQIGNDSSLSGDFEYAGYITNLRVIRSSAIYSGLFTPPTRKLKKVTGTVLLCCQDEDSVTTEATGKTITTSGNPTASNFTPQIGDDRKVTFEGVTKINTDAYFYLPTGDTGTRDSRSGRILWAGGQDGGASPGFINLIQYANITTTGNALDFGDMVERATSAASSSSTRAVIFDGLTPSLINRIEKVEIASTGNATDYGDSTMSVFETASASNNTRGLNGGGYSSGSGTPANTETIEYITIASIGNALDFGDLTMGRRGAGALSSPIRACFAAGYQQPDASGTRTDRIDYVTIASTGNAIDFGNLTESGWGPTGMSNSVRGVYAGRLSPGSPGYETTIDYITIASTGDAIDFGDTTTGGGRGAGSSNKTRGVFILGNAAPSPNIQNYIDYITIATTGNAKDFGDLISKTHQAGSTSDSHGGLG